MLTYCPICGEYEKEVRKENKLSEYPSHKCDEKILSKINGAQTRGDNDDLSTGGLHENRFWDSLNEGFRLAGLGGDI